MARSTGAVRFPNGDLMYFVYNGTVDLARPRLFPTAQAAGAAWDDDQRGDGSLWGGATPGDTIEVVDVMPFYSLDSSCVHFKSAASRAESRLTGPRSLDQADDLLDGNVTLPPIRVQTRANKQSYEYNKTSC